MLNPVSASKNNIVALAFVFLQSYVFVLSVFCVMLVPICLLQTSVIYSFLTNIFLEIYNPADRLTISDVQPRRARPREAGARDGEGLGPRQAAAGGRVHHRRQDQGHQR